MPPPITTRLLDSRSAAAYCGYSLRHWQALVRQGSVKFAQIGRSYVFAQADLDHFIKRHPKDPRGRKPRGLDMSPDTGREEIQP